jgi:hypothetical protein
LHLLVVAAFVVITPADKRSPVLRRISVEYKPMYIGEQYWIANIQPIEIIEHQRTVADGEGLIIWPSQG